MSANFKQLRQITAICLLCLPAWPVYSAVAPDPLANFFDGLQTLQADFVQHIVNESGEVLQTASGTLSIQRPGRFRWDYEKPYRQLVLADGQRLWSYDEDLEQAVVKELDEVLSATPAMLLTGYQPVAEVFLVTQLELEDGIQWVELQPRTTDTGFDKIQLGFADRELSRMTMKDLFGQYTKFEFSHVRRNERLEPSLFTFLPPPGVDVVGTQ